MPHMHWRQGVSTLGFVRSVEKKAEGFVRAERGASTCAPSTLSPHLAMLDIAAKKGPTVVSPTNISSTQHNTAHRLSQSSLSCSAVHPLLFWPHAHLVCGAQRKGNNRKECTTVCMYVCACMHTRYTYTTATCTDGAHSAYTCKLLVHVCAHVAPNSIIHHK